mgnify:CR=1 FL=1
MHTIAETEAYKASVKLAKISIEEQVAIVDFLALNPSAGDLIVGSGGCRKLRFARKGKGKSGGYRIITYFANINRPLILMLAYSKTQTEDLKKEQIRNLYNYVKTYEN